MHLIPIPQNVLASLSASRLVATDAASELVSVSNFASWIAGTTNRVTVTDDTDGTITLSGPQDLHTAASPTFHDLTLTEGTISSNIGNSLTITTATDPALPVGSISLIGGDSDYAGGNITLTAGNLTSTDHSTNVGNISLIAGDAVSVSADGGNISITAGDTPDAGNLGGSITIQSGNNLNPIGSSGNINLVIPATSGGQIYCNGSTRIQSLTGLLLGTSGVVSATENSTATKKFLNMTSSVPSWDVLGAGDIPALAYLPIGGGTLTGNLEVPELITIDRDLDIGMGRLLSATATSYWTTNLDSANDPYDVAYNSWFMRLGDDGTFNNFSIQYIPIGVDRSSIALFSVDSTGMVVCDSLDITSSSQSYIKFLNSVCIDSGCLRVYVHNDLENEGATVGGKLAEDLTTHGNAAGTETDLASYALPSGIGGNDTMKLHAFGKFGATANADKRVKIYYGTATILDVYPGNPASSGVSFEINVTIVGYGGDTHKVVASLLATVGPVVTTVTTTLCTQDDSASPVLRITGNGTSTSDVLIYASALHYETGI